MLYQKYLKKLKGCPFCEFKRDEILRQNSFAVLMLAQAPYTKDHLLVIPKRHVKKLNKMTANEKDAVEKLVYYGMKKLHKKHKNVTVLYKEGNKKEVGKSIEHLHYHLIPDMQIGGHDINWKTRKMMSDKDYGKMVKGFKSKF